MLPPARDHAALAARFRWRVPSGFSIPRAACDDWAARAPDRPCVLDVGADGRARALTYGLLRERSSRLAGALAARGVGAGDRVGVLLGQGALVPVAHLAAMRLGAIALPLSVLFGAEALRHRLADAGARAVLTDARGAARLAPLRAALPALEVVVSSDGADAGADALGLEALLEGQASHREPVDGAADDPCLMIYTSGTTGPPKGALHAHRVLLGHLPGVELPHEFLGAPGDRLWTPADWAWAGGLLNVLMPGLMLGVPVVAKRFEGGFDPDAAMHLMATQEVRNAFVPPTALRMMAAAPLARSKPKLRSLASGGEALGEAAQAFGREVLGLPVNEFYGQTEANLVLASCAGLGVMKPGHVGKAVPGHRVAVLRADGSPCEPGEEGGIAVARETGSGPDPVIFLRYWNDEAATAAKFVTAPDGSEWMTTGDRAVMDEAGYARFVGREDDVITSSGYRIGPQDVEDCLLTHPAVALAAVVGKPDALRTEVVKAFVVLKEGEAPSEALADALKAHVRARLSAHEHPREVAFLEALPLTTTGKVVRRALRELG